eukprot:TRINITY_DN492_c0_g1_i7.p1 TRINITY_DN492_c0_g1~~TRINITY_DN492_c0_g1_i7.p1  ORF type:complete len:1124 (+),score=271.51 TRINITY_DN492_c0_g1_i7:1568-4939(+)
MESILEPLNNTPQFKKVRKRKKNKKARLRKIILKNGEEIVTGDFVLLKSKDPNIIGHVARVAEMFQYSSSGKSFKPMVQCQWFFRPQDTLHGRSHACLPNEVFLTDCMDQNLAKSILRKCQVSSCAKGSEFFCRMFYDNEKSAFRGLTDKEKDLLSISPEMIEITSSFEPSMSQTSILDGLSSSLSPKSCGSSPKVIDDCGQFRHQLAQLAPSVNDVLREESVIGVKYMEPHFEEEAKKTKFLHPFESQASVLSFEQWKRVLSDRAQPSVKTHRFAYSLQAPSVSEVENIASNLSTSLIPSYGRFQSQDISAENRSYLRSMYIEVHGSCGERKFLDPLRDELACLFVTCVDEDSNRRRCWIAMQKKFLQFRIVLPSQTRLELCENEDAIFEWFIRNVRSEDPDILLGFELQQKSLGFCIFRYHVKFKKNLCLELGRVKIADQEKRARAPASDSEVHDPLETAHGDGKISHEVAEKISLSVDISAMESDEESSEEDELKQQASGKKALSSEKDENEAHQELHPRTASHKTSVEDVVKDKYGYKSQSGFHISGRIVLNLWRIMKSEVKERSYTLQAMAKAILKKRIPEFATSTLDEWLTDGKGSVVHLFFTHYLRMLHVCADIVHELGIIHRTAELARVIGIDFFSVISRGSQFKIESLMLRLAKPRGFVALSPSRRQVAQQLAIECIPLVMEPKSQLYSSPVVVLDFQSLYPSVIIAYNLCFSTCLGKLVPGKKAFGTLPDYQIPHHILAMLEERDVSLSPNGVMFVKKHLRFGIVPRMLEEILHTRVQVKARMKKLHCKNSPEYRTLDAQQHALKMIANTTYGYISASFSGRMPCADIADAIVQYGRETMEKAVEMIENEYKDVWRGKVVYGDSVLGDTPVVIRHNGLIRVSRVDELFPIGNGTTEKWRKYHGGKHCLCPSGLEVWQDGGFVPVRRIIRHVCNKPLMRVVTSHGMVDATIDHSLLRLDGSCVSPSESCIGERLLHAIDAELIQAIRAARNTGDRGWSVPLTSKILFSAPSRIEDLHTKSNLFGISRHFLCQFYNRSRMECSVDIQDSLLRTLKDRGSSYKIQSFWNQPSFSVPILQRTWREENTLLCLFTLSNGHGCLLVDILEHAWISQVCS